MRSEKIRKDVENLPKPHPGSLLSKAVKRPTNRQLKDRELLLLMRKIRPLVSDAVLAAAKVVRNEGASDSARLAASKMLLDTYRRLTLDLYADADPEEVGVEVQQQNTPVFSLRVIGEDDEPEELSYKEI